MKKLAALLFFVAASATAQVAPVWVTWSDAWLNWNGTPAGPLAYGAVQVGGVAQTVEPALNLIAGTNITLTPADVAGVSTNVTIASSAGGGGLADPGGNGMVARTALNTTINRTIVCAAAYCTWANGDGVAGAPSLTLGLTTTNDAGAIVKQATTPGTQQGSGGNANFNINGSGIMQLDAIATTPTDQLTLQNTTAATGGVTQQYSGAIKLCGTAWNTASSDTNCFRIYNKTNNGATTTANLYFDTSIAGGAYNNRIQFSDTGAITLINAGITIPNNRQWSWSGRAILTSGATGQITAQDSAFTVGSGIWVGGTYKTEQTSGAVVTLDPGAAARTELTTLSTGSTTTATAGNLVPAACKLEAVLLRVTTAITTAANFTVKVTGGNVLNQIGTATSSNATLTLGATYTMVPAAFADQYITSASTLTYTTNINPGAGAIRAVVVCESFTPPTS